MSHEIELKFQVPPERLAALHQALGGHGSHQVLLAARYFDTADERLARGRAALRLRHEGTGWVQTLKAEGAQTLQRLEHNVALPADAAPAALPPGTLPDPARHDGHAAGERLRALLGDAPLAEQYRTEIRRTLRQVRHQGATLELALDEGEIVAGAQRLPVCELEIELVDGPLPPLLDLAGRWAERHGLWLDVRSKSERGHRLAGLDRALARGEPPPPWPVASARPRPRPATVAAASTATTTAATTAEAAARARVNQALQPALANAAVLADAAGGRPEHLQQLRVALRRLRALARVCRPPGPAGAGWVATEPALATLSRGLGAAWHADRGAGPLLRSAATQRLWLGLMAQAWGVAMPDSAPAPAEGLTPTEPAPTINGIDTGDDAIHLRPAVPDDALCLSVLAMQVFLDTYCTEGIRPAVAREVLGTYRPAAFDAALADPATRVVVAERAGHLVGFAQVTLGAAHELAPAGAPAELLRLYVQEPFTGRHLGTALLAAAEQVAVAAGATVLWLTPWVHNHRAIAFYRRRGYADHGLTWFEFEGERHENRVFARRLAVVG